jgi:nitrate/nitrite transporter NarK
VTDTAAALGFISAIGAVGGFFIPKTFGLSLAYDRLAGRRDENFPGVLPLLYRH